MSEESRLTGGPQDGGRVTGVGGGLPEIIYVGPKWLGDGFTTWSREPSHRFPAIYEWDGFTRYEFAGWYIQEAGR